MVIKKSVDPDNRARLAYVKQRAKASGRNFIFSFLDTALKTGWNIFDIKHLAEKQNQDCGHIFLTNQRYVFINI